VTENQVLKDQIEIRKNEILEFRKELSSITKDSNLYKQIFGEDVQGAWINMSKFTVAGHSFGGLTAVEVADELRSENCHACLTLDPWLSPIGNKIKEPSLATDP